MAENIQILNSKLTAPHLADTIKRERLLSLISQLVRKRLTTIVAGAGYGKTTLVAQAISCWSIKTVWYRLDESDRDLATFISYLVAGIRKYYPEFGFSTLQYLRETHNLHNELQSALNTFLGEIENTIQEDTIIVLDDYHSVKESQEIKEALEIFLRDLSPLIHLILISRSEPALPLSRLRSMREVIDIREENLAFIATEIEQLYSEMFDVSLDRANIDTIYHKLGGWIAGLILLCHSLRGKPSVEIEKNLLNLGGSQKAIFSYLEENIYGALPPERQEFLIKTSIFSRINAKFCDRLLHLDYSLDVLRYLEGNHLFTSCIDEKEQWYSYHQLFRDFLLSRLKDELDHEAIVRLHREAAILLERGGEEAEAIRHYLMAEEYERACGLLKHVGRRLFTEGRFQLLSSFLNEIPADYLEADPWIQYLQAQLTGLRGHHEMASAKYNQALNCFLKRKDEEGVQGCLIESGLIHFQTGNLKEAQKRFQELLDHKDLDPRLQIEVLGYLIYISSYLGDMSHADRCFDEALSLLQGLADADLRYECLKWIYYYRGFRFVFSADYTKVLEIVEYVKTRSPDSEPQRYPVPFYLLLSVAYYGLQLYSEGYATAREGLSILKAGRPQSGMTASGWHSPRLSPRGERGFPETFTSWLLVYSAKNAAELGKITEAIEDAGESLKRFRKMGCRLGEAFSYTILHRAYLKSGNGVAAEQWARSGIDAIRGLTLPRPEAILKLNLAETLIEKGEPEEALQLLREADGCIHGIHDTVRINFLYARLYWSNDQVGDGLLRLLTALEMCERHPYHSLVIAEKHWVIPPLVEVFAQGKMRTYILEILGKMGPDAAAALALLQDSRNPIIREAAANFLRELTKASRPSLRIYLLGQFRVLLGSKEIPAARWKSRKAKTLLQFLIYSRPRGYLNKEVLMELLWPEEAPGITAKRFHVALASLRKTLEPEIVRGVTSSYISRVGDSYRIDLGEEGWVDLENFTAELERARKESDPETSIAHFVKAESLYSGDFLEEDLYSEWCSGAREKFRKDYLYLTKQVVAYYERQGGYPQCLEYAQKYLEVDKYAEDIYRSLMRCYWETGDKFSLAQTFKKCRDNITKELSCGLSEETQQLYRNLVSNWRG
ncbi:MAG: BTAD domain-containing putative transcriptional regulator [Desulfobaccales bacterium]